MYPSRAAFRAGWFPFILAVALLCSGCGKPCEDLRVYVINADGSNLHRVTLLHEKRPIGVEWTRDGRISEGGCTSWKPDGSDPRQMRARSAGGECHTGGSPLSPNSREKVVLWHDVNFGEYVVVVRTSDGKRLRVLTTTHDIVDASWSPGKQILYVRENDYVVAVNPDGTDRHRIRLQGESDKDPGNLFWTATGRISDGCVSWKANGSDRRRVAKPPQPFTCTPPNLSPDGRKKVVMVWQNGVADLYIVRISDGKRLRRLTPAAADIAQDTISWGPRNQIIWAQDNGNPDQDKCGD